MPKKPEWTGEVIKQMHINGIMQKQIAQELGVSKVWLSMILNGRVAPDGAEQRIRKAIQKILSEA